VSDYVRRRQIEVGLVPADRVVRVWNGMEVPPSAAAAERVLHDALGIGRDRLIVACACRTAPEKGVPVLMKAFDLVWQRWPADRVKPLLVYMGDGPQYPEVQQLRPQLASAEDIILTGYRLDAVRLVGGADVCAMPSVWEDALPLAVMQPMAQGRPVVASSVGGIPEMIVDAHTGVLVPPNDVPALADALERLLTDRAWAAALGAEARSRIASMFTRSQQIDALSGILGRLVGMNA
jgi:glycosyltransferase involved in cell wall biosynthesis